MFLTTAAIRIGMKVKEDRQAKREERQGKLQIGCTETARTAFANQTNAIGSGVGIQRTGTDIKYDGPDEVSSQSPSTAGVSSPSDSEKAAFAALSPNAAQPTTLGRPSRSHSDLRQPPPYTERAATASSTTDTQLLSPASTAESSLSPVGTTRSKRSISLGESDNVSIITRGSKGTQAIRIKTNGAALSSGFPYHPALFDVRVRPDEWDRFTFQITECTKFGIGDHAKMWSAATATALTGAIATSVWVGRTMNRSLQEKKVKEGLLDMKDGGLGDTLQQWNDQYFKEKGLFAHLELSEHAMKYRNQKSKTIRKHSSLNATKEERERIKEERKFVIIISKLDDEGMPSEAVHELADEGVNIPELAGSDTSDAIPKIAELAGGDVLTHSTLPAEMPSPAFLPDEKKDPTGLPEGYAELPAAEIAELDSSPVTPMKDLSIDEKLLPPSTDTLRPPPLLVNGRSQTSFGKEIE